MSAVTPNIPPPQHPKDERTIPRVLAVALITLAVLLLPLVLIALVLVIPLGMVVGPMVLFLELLVIATTMRRVRKRRAMAILGYVNQAVALNLPLPSTLAAAQQSEQGATRTRLRHLRELLLRGAFLFGALEAAVPEIPRRTLSNIGAAERVGQLPRTLRRLVADELADTPRDPTTASFYWVYPLVMVLVFGVLCIFVMPKFEQIFRDYRTALPPITVAVLWGCRTWGPLVVLLAVVSVLLVVARALAQTFSAARLGESILGPLTDRLMWYAPLLHGAVRDRGLADVCQILADAVENGLPLDRALLESSEASSNILQQQQIRRWWDGIQQGLSISTAARQAGLPKVLVGLLATGANNPDPAAVFAFLARYYRGRFSRLRLLLQGALVPAVVFIFGGIVMAAALSLFLPLMSLIQTTSMFSSRAM